MDIKIRGLRENNLNNLNLNLPTGQLTVICGPSGAGKTSLVLGTLFAESQRRFIETIGTRRRNKFSLWKRADLDSIENLPPAITVSDVVPDSETLASVSGLDDSIALEFSQKSIAKCPNCNTEIPFGTPDSIAAQLARNFNQQRGQIAFSPFSDELPFDKLPVLAVEYAGRGFSRWIFGSQTVDITDKSAFQTAMKTAQADSTYIVADRVLFKPSDTRLTDSLESAFTEGGGKAVIFIYSPDSNVSPVKIFVGLGYCCPHCGRILASPVTERFYLDELPPAPSALREDILAYQLNGKNLLDWYNLSAAQIDTALFPQTAAIQSVGLGYMPISRSVKSMSSGQIKRAALAAVLAGELVNMLYVFDEPTEGLPPENRPALLNALKQLVKRGNTVVIAENDPDFIAQADAVIELNQGNIVKATSKTALTSTSDIQSESISESSSPLTPTSDIQSESISESSSESSSESPESIENIPPTARRLNTAIANRLILSIPAVTPRSITIPTGQSTVICGPAGAGKTTLLIRGLYPAVLKKLNVSIPDFVTPVVCKLETYTDVSDCILLQQRSQRKPIKGCIATYLKLWDKIRDLLAETAQSASHGFSAGDFSLHSGAGRCPECKGEGGLKINIEYLPEIEMVCDECQGQRFRSEYLQVRYRGLNAAEILHLSVRDAFAFFRNVRSVQFGLKTLIDVGLEYVQLGQSINALSGGVFQRINLAAAIGSIRKQKTLFLLDDPSAGVHVSELHFLHETFDRLTDYGHTIVMIENNPAMISWAPNIIRL